MIISNIIVATIPFAIVHIAGTNFTSAANINENTSDSIKFIIGPAADTIASAALVDILPLKFLGFISTGLPQPI